MADTELFGSAIKVIENVGFIGMLLLILIGGYRGYWVWGRYLDEVKETARQAVTEAKRERDELRRERDMWQEIALKGTHIADRALSAANLAVKRE